MKKVKHIFGFSVIFFILAFLAFFTLFKIHFHGNSHELFESGKVLDVGEDFIVVDGRRGVEFRVVIDEDTSFIRGRHLSGDFPRVGEMVVFSGFLNEDGEVVATSVYILRS